MCFIFVAFVLILDKLSQYLLVLWYQTLVCVQHSICRLGMVLDGELVTSENGMMKQAALFASLYFAPLASVPLSFTRRLESISYCYYALYL